MAVLQAYQADLLKDLSVGSTIDEEAFAEFRRAIGLSLCATKQMARAIGQSMSALVSTERHLWLNLTAIKEKEHLCLLDSPISPSGLFGDSVNMVVNKFEEVKKHEEDFVQFFPCRTQGEGPSATQPCPLPSKTREVKKQSVVDRDPPHQFSAVHPVILEAFCPPPFTTPEQEKSYRLCPVRVLQTYVHRTSQWRNLALNAWVVQSSLGNPQGAAEHAVDGNRDSNYAKGSCTLTKVEFNPWWRADLGNVYSISNVSITNRGDCCKERLRGAQIRIGNKLENNGNNNELAATVLTVPNGTVTFVFEPVNGRYVNIFLPGNDEILTLCEVEVFAEKDKPLYTCGPRNLALGGKAVQSTTNSGLGVAQNAIDGNRQSIHALGSCSVTNGDKDPWWRVDLLDVYRVTRVSITNRGDCCEKRIEGVQIRIGNSLENNGNNNFL
ncbi:uncharacterized protein LOC113040897 [Carassius auratus]|uniref:Uncharacterized protein LOC113040897 n=1 Tax=Carassius auratus TaxID=7957 RepID=A0A6P6JAM9_CARAU|nr:uncharacterized protein LOC113040897 [Carassius auratus]